MASSMSAMTDIETPAIRQISTRQVYSNPWLVLREDEIERLDGSRGIYSVIEKPDFSIVIPFENDGFHLVEQYRYPASGRFWEFPQGAYPNREDGDPRVLAERELAEETGLIAASMVHLGRLGSKYGLTTQGCHVYLATDLTSGDTARETEEQDMRQCWVPRAQFESMIADGSVTDDSSIAGYALFLLAERGVLNT